MRHNCIHLKIFVEVNNNEFNNRNNNEFNNRKNTYSIMKEIQ